MNYEKLVMEMLGNEHGVSFRWELTVKRQGITESVAFGEDGQKWRYWTGEVGTFEWGRVRSALSEIDNHNPTRKIVKIRGEGKFRDDVQAVTHGDCEIIVGTASNHRLLYRHDVTVYGWTTQFVDAQRRPVLKTAKGRFFVLTERGAFLPTYPLNNA